MPRLGRGTQTKRPQRFLGLETYRLEISATKSEWSISREPYEEQLLERVAETMNSVALRPARREGDVTLCGGSAASTAVSRSRATSQRCNAADALAAGLRTRRQDVSRAPGRRADALRGRRERSSPTSASGTVTRRSRGRAGACGPLPRRREPCHGTPSRRHTVQARGGPDAHDAAGRSSRPELHTHRHSRREDPTVRLSGPEECAAGVQPRVPLTVLPPAPGAVAP